MEFCRDTAMPCPYGDLSIRDVLHQRGICCIGCNIKSVGIEIIHLSLLSYRASKLDFYGGRNAQPQDFQSKLLYKFDASQLMSLCPLWFKIIQKQT